MLKRPQIISKLLFDQKDHELIKIVNEVQSKEKSLQYAKKLFYNYFHPHGIKEMAESKGLRIAYAVVHLLESIEVGKVDDRLSALRSLRDEVLNAADGPIPINTARILVQIMKELVRVKDDYYRQLELARDFRMAAAGNPRIVRTQLVHYHLLEMPEEWNQISFDDHVHDANTKGRKSSTHLIMDAWIKGIRRLRVMYYNYILPSQASELIQAAEIMGIAIRIGIEFSAKFRNRYVQLVWVPRGFPDSQSFLSFLAESPVMAFMNLGREVSEYQQQYVLSVLQKFNEKHRNALSNKYEINILPITQSDLLAFVGSGQTSLLHLAEFIHIHVIAAMKTTVENYKINYAMAPKEERDRIKKLVKEMNKLDPNVIMDDYLKPDKNPDIPDPNIPSENSDVPELLHMSPRMIVNKLIQLYSGYSRLTLNLSNLYAEDVLEILYDCDGLITRLETFNLKDFQNGKNDNIADINHLQIAINSGNIILLKRVIKNIIERVNQSKADDKSDRIEKLTNILHNIEKLKKMYKETPIKSRIGSDSTGRSQHIYGMGFVIKETLPVRSQRKIRLFSDSLSIIPANITANLRITYIPSKSSSNMVNYLYSWMRIIPVLNYLAYDKKRDWETQAHTTQIGSSGNIITLGGILKNFNNGLSIEEAESKSKQISITWKYLKTSIKNGLKILIGFIPAFATFALTKDWWLLAYFGSFIWFGITGFRFIVQSVLGGGGIRGSQLLRWNDYVRWERLTDSLLFTGFSVPLLDYFAKTILLKDGLGITTSNHPFILYSVMAIANGLYLVSHNLFRGLPRVAAFANFFRSILSIPLAILFSAATGGILSSYGFKGIDDILQKWAAIISKAASDCVAGVIEGTADRYYNINHRLFEYKNKFKQLLDAYAKLELIFPDADILEILAKPEKFMQTTSTEAHDLENIIIINALDMLYIWNYQPRARTAFKMFLRKLSQEERHILLRSQFILLRQRKISHMLIDGILGRNFSKALSFYLDRSPDYLKTMQKIASIK